MCSQERHHELLADFGRQVRVADIARQVQKDANLAVADAQQSAREVGSLSVVLICRDKRREQACRRSHVTVAFALCSSASRALSRLHVVCELSVSMVALQVLLTCQPALIVRIRVICLTRRRDPVLPRLVCRSQAECLGLIACLVANWFDVIRDVACLQAEDKCALVRRVALQLQERSRALAAENALLRSQARLCLRCWCCTASCTGSVSLLCLAIPSVRLHCAIPVPLQQTLDVLSVANS